MRKTIISYSGENKDLEEFLKFLNRVYDQNARVIDIFRERTEIFQTSSTQTQRS